MPMCAHRSMFFHPFLSTIGGVAWRFPNVRASIELSSISFSPNWGGPDEPPKGREEPCLQMVSDSRARSGRQISRWEEAQTWS